MPGNILDKLYLNVSNKKIRPNKDIIKITKYKNIIQEFMPFKTYLKRIIEMVY